MKELKINTNYKIELFSLIAFLSNLNEQHAVDRSINTYTNQLIDSFSQFTGHKAVQEFPLMWERGICWDTVPLLVLHLTDDFEFHSNIPVTEKLKSEYDGDFNDAVKYLRLVRDFAETTNFKQFFKMLGDDKIVIQARKRASEIPVVEILEKYIKIKLPIAEVIVSNLSFTSFGVTIQTLDDKRVYCIIGKKSLEMAIEYDNFDRILLGTIWHEFLHSIINPLTDNLFDNPFNLSDSQVEWYCQLNESIIWAVCFRLLLRIEIVTCKSIDWYFTNAERNNAIKARSMNTLLEEYEKSIRFKDIRNFYPVLIEVMKQDNRVEGI